MHINPDYFLETPNGRIYTPERNNHAWQQCYLALKKAIQSGQFNKVYLLIGCQASGKTSWAKQQLKVDSKAIIFDAILVKSSERKKVIDIIKQSGMEYIAVYFQTELSTCLKRNLLRPADEIVDQSALRNVFNALERPTLNEGFTQIIIV
nr:AAA family ATPase [Acinetobacter sp. Marseille-Q1620]